RMGHLLTDFGYAAPELCLGYPATPSGDIYAVGVMLWESLARVRRTFASSVADSLRLRTSGEEPGIEELYPDVPERLAQICRRALAVSPRDRYPDAAEMRIDLESYLADTQPESEQLGEQEVALAPLAELMDHHFASERSEMLLFIGSQWSDAAEAAATRVALAAAAVDDDAEDTLANDVSGLPEPFLASNWDDHTHTVTGFEVLDTSAPLSSIRSSANTNAAPEFPRAPASTASVGSDVLREAPSAQSTRAGFERPHRPIDSHDATAPELRGNPELRSPELHAGPELREIPEVHAPPEPVPSAPEEPSHVPRRFLALTEPIDPALMEAAVRRRRAAHGARSREIGWPSHWQRLHSWVRTLNPGSLGLLGIALAVVSLALVTRGALTTRHGPSASKASAKAAAPLATVHGVSSASGALLEAKSSARAAVHESSASATSAPVSNEGLVRSALDGSSSAHAAEEPRLAAEEPRLARASGSPADAAPSAPRLLASEPARAAASGSSNSRSTTSSTGPSDVAPSSDLANVDSDTDAVYLRSEDVERLREVGVLSSSGSRSYPSRPSRATRAKAKEDPSPATLHILSPEPRLIDETDPYTP
ncbi:MAG TPA: hypothetical protein VG963_31395, partial [Polyangiaceae bacterium]|nr:hypothetical protein [Polyangiaceae bacterium]